MGRPENISIDKEININTGNKTANNITEKVLANIITQFTLSAYCNTC